MGNATVQCANRFTEEFGEHPSDVVICASMTHQAEWQKVAKQLQAEGLDVLQPNTTEHLPWNELPDETVTKEKSRFVREHLAFVSSSRAILVCNYNKDGQDNYIGANAFLEMTAAYIWDKPIFILHSIPVGSNRDEILALQPKVLNGNMGGLINYLKQGEQ